MERHFTATAFVVHNDRTLLHWHRKLQQWMPPGGHLLPNEDPGAGALREVLEETGLAAELIPTTIRHDFAYPEQLPAPYTVLLEDIAEHGAGPHQHIDLIYFARSLDGAAVRPPTDDDVLRWVSRDQLERREPLSSGAATVAPPDDVRELALVAIDVVGAFERERG